jgi:hypothetical protein
MTDASDYPGANNTSTNPTFMSQYCNGSRTPPEYQSLGYQVPPGISDATVPNPIFSLTPAATVDEGNNWINISWGPLAMTSPVTNATLGNYAPASSSSAINHITSAAIAVENTALVGDTTVPTTDFLGRTRPQGSGFDSGAVEFIAAAATAVLNVTGGPLAFGTQPLNSTSPAQTLTLHNTGTAGATGIAVSVTAPFARAGGTCGATLAAGATCTITVTFTPTALGAATGTATITANVAVSGSPVGLSGTGVARSPVSITPNPLTITLPTGTNTGTGTVTLRNTGAAGTASVTVSSVAVNNGTGGGLTTWFFNAVVGSDNCTGTTLAPGASCTVGVRFTNVGAARGVNRPGTIVFTDNGVGSPQTGNLIGHAN